MERLDLDYVLDGVDLVLVHEWNDPGLVQRIGKRRAHTRGYRVLFHGTHHRSITDPNSMAAYDLSHYGGVLAFGKVIRDLYLARGWTSHAWTWHEAAGTRIFHPLEGVDCEGELVWVDNWGMRSVRLNCLNSW